MPTVTRDVISGASIEISSGGNRIARRCLIEGVVGSPSRIILDAINNGQLPQKGQEHEDIPGFFVSSIRASPASQGDNKAFFVDYVYEPFSSEVLPPSENTPPELSVGTTLVEVDTNIDINGDTLIVTYQNRLPQSGLVRKKVPVPFVRFVRIEPNGPSRKSEDYSGKINSSGWYGDPPGTWMCTKLEGEYRPKQGDYRVTYEFQRCVNLTDKWNAVVYYIDPTTGKPPADLVDGEGRIAYTVYESIDFNQLNLGV